MKHSILAVIGLLAFLAGSVINTQAQVPVYAPQTLSSTATIASATATNIAAVIDCRKQKTVGLQITSYGDTGVAANKAFFVYSVDGVSYSSLAVAGQFTSVSFTPTTTGSTIFTNLDTYGAGYMKLSYVTNDTGASVTNLVIKYGVKIGAP